MEKPVLYLRQNSLLKLSPEEIPILVRIFEKRGISAGCIDFEQRIVDFPQGYVGYINFPSRKVIIRPKHEGLTINHILRIYYFLYSNDCGDCDEQIYDVDPGDTTDLITVYMAELNKIVRKGLPVEYFEETQDLSVLKGGLDLLSTGINLKLKRRDAFRCTYEDLSRNIPLNQVLFAAYRKVSEIRELQETGRIERNFQGVVQPGVLPRIEVNRNTAYCKKALALAYMILDDLNIADCADRGYGESLLINFDRVFEEFVKQVLLRYSADPGFTCWETAKPYARYEWEKEEHEKSYLPDLLYRYERRWDGESAAAILDMKNKTSNPFSNADVYQMLFYAGVLKSKKVILCYPSAEDRKPAVLQFDYEGLPLKKLHAVSINLSGNRSEEFKENLLRFIEQVNGVI